MDCLFEAVGLFVDHRLRARSAHLVTDVGVDFAKRALEPSKLINRVLKMTILAPIDLVVRQD